MRDSLQEHQEQGLRKKVHQHLFDYYGNRLNNIDLKRITDRQETAIREAFYHGKNIKEAQDFFDW